MFPRGPLQPFRAGSIHILSVSERKVHSAGLFGKRGRSVWTFFLQAAKPVIKRIGIRSNDDFKNHRSPDHQEWIIGIDRASGYQPPMELILQDELRVFKRPGRRYDCDDPISSTGSFGRPSRSFRISGFHAPPWHSWKTVHHHPECPVKSIFQLHPSCVFFGANPLFRVHGNDSDLNEL